VVFVKPAGQLSQANKLLCNAVRLCQNSTALFSATQKPENPEKSKKALLALLLFLQAGEPEQYKL
jgi:hypothetical protein